jgi:hypothetical protein
MRGEGVDGISQSFHDGLALLGDAQAGQVLTLRVCLGGLDEKNLLRIGLLTRRLSES